MPIQPGLVLLKPLLLHINSAIICITKNDNIQRQSQKSSAFFFRIELRVKHLISIQIGVNMKSNE